MFTPHTLHRFTIYKFMHWIILHNGSHHEPLSNDCRLCKMACQIHAKDYDAVFSHIPFCDLFIRLIWIWWFQEVSAPTWNTAISRPYQIWGGFGLHISFEFSWKNSNMRWWRWSLMPYGVTRPQWDKINFESWDLTKFVKMIWDLQIYNFWSMYAILNCWEKCWKNIESPL